MRKTSNTKKDSSPRISCVAEWRLIKVRPLPNYKLEVEFVDGTHGFVEMEQRVTSEKAGVFAALKNVALFNQVYLEYGAVTWPGEIDLSPDAMHDEIKRYGKWVLN
jgi:hypothetical protein